jgi:aspartate/methionine/tyrosine aminotransferase
VVWAFSKDFALNGLRCGVLVSENPEVRAAAASQAMWGSVSSLTQVVLGDLIADEEWTDTYLAEMRSRLRSIHHALTDALTGAHIPHLPADAGFFVLIDLREFLEEATWEAEERLWRRVLEEANVNLTPGSACRISEPGFFRLCFAPVPLEASLEGVARIHAALQPKR